MDPKVRTLLSKFRTKGNSYRAPTLTPKSVANDLIRAYRRMASTRAAAGRRDITPLLTILHQRNAILVADASHLSEFDAVVTVDEKTIGVIDARDLRKFDAPSLKTLTKRSFSLGIEEVALVCNNSNEVVSDLKNVIYWVPQSEAEFESIKFSENRNRCY